MGLLMADATSAQIKSIPPRVDRTVAAILLATIFVLTNFPALYFLGRSCFDSFPAERSFGGGAVRFQDELIGHCISDDDQLVFKTDLHNGRTRFENTSLAQPVGFLVSNDNRFWSVSRDVVIVADGTSEERYTPQGASSSPISGVFLYHNCPGIVDFDDSGVKFHLYVFQDGE